MLLLWLLWSEASGRRGATIFFNKVVALEAKTSKLSRPAMAARGRTATS
jgi:hypothetical protein